MNSTSDFARLSAIVTSSDDAIISKDFDGIIKTWNNAATNLFGFTAGEAIGKHISIIIPDEFLEEEKNFIAEIKRGSHIKHYEAIRKRNDGSTFPASITVSPIKDAETNVVGISIIARDITERKLNEHNESLLASIISSSDDAIVSKNLQGIITSWNYGAQKIFGYTAAEAVGRNISIIIPESKRDEEADIISKIARGEKIDHIETIRKTKAGKEINMSVTISPIKDGNNNIIGASKIARDITQKKEIEKQKQVFIKKLQRLNEYKDDFMMMASHELKTPITIIKANLQILHELVTKGVADITFVNKSLHQVEKLSNLISELMDVSKIQNGKLDLHISLFNLFGLLKEIVAEMQQITSDHKIVLNKSEQSLEIKADRERIKQVLVNMLGNAIKYSPGGEEINIETSVKENGVIVKVKDNGIGIPAEDIDKVFTRFYRAGGVASTFSGAGIGLYISSEIIRHHGGKMWVESEPDKGSVFYFEIPWQIPKKLPLAM
jgi:PAS domain S-box-containing protein